MTIQRDDGTLGNAVSTVLRQGGDRITGINDYTHDRVLATVRATVVSSMEDGDSMAVLGKKLESALDGLGAFGEYRSELIARTETMFAYNTAALTTYSGYGVDRVQAIDGDKDEECAARNGKDYSIYEASSIQDHPNGTLDWVPFFTPRATPTKPTPEPIKPEPVKPKPVRISDADVQRARDAFNARIRQQELDDIARNRARNDAAAAAGKKGPDVSLIAGQPAKPVSAAFDDIMAKVQASSLAMRDAQYVKVVDKIKSALGTIDKTFKDGNLPAMPHIAPIKGGNSALQGRYKFSLSREPMAMEFRANAHMETVFHEISHFIDHHGLGNGTTFMSKLGFAQARGKLDELTASLKQSLAFDRTRAGAQAADRVAHLERELAEMETRADVFAPVAQAIIDSKGYRTLTEALANGRLDYVQVTPGGSVTSSVIPLNPSTRKWVTYARAPEEAFARAMGQYLSRRSGAAAIKEIEETLYYPGTRVLRPLADQWEADDFQAIDDAITEMFRKLSWLVN